MVILDAQSCFGDVNGLIMLQYVAVLCVSSLMISSNVER